jgi:hypothetical protein
VHDITQAETGPAEKEEEEDGTFQQRKEMRPVEEG